MHSHNANRRGPRARCRARIGRDAPCSQLTRPGAAPRRRMRNPLPEVRSWNFESHKPSHLFIVCAPSRSNLVLENHALWVQAASLILFSPTGPRPQTLPGCLQVGTSFLSRPQELSQVGLWFGGPTLSFFFQVYGVFQAAVVVSGVGRLGSRFVLV